MFGAICGLSISGCAINNNNNLNKFIRYFRWHRSRRWRGNNVHRAILFDWICFRWLESPVTFCLRKITSGSPLTQPNKSTGWHHACIGRSNYCNSRNARSMEKETKNDTEMDKDRGEGVEKESSWKESIRRTMLRLFIICWLMENLNESCKLHGRRSH